MFVTAALPQAPFPGRNRHSNSLVFREHTGGDVRETRKGSVRASAARLWQLAMGVIFRAIAGRMSSRSCLEKMACQVGLAVCIDALASCLLQPVPCKCRRLAITTQLDRLQERNRPR